MNKKLNPPIQKEVAREVLGPAFQAISAGINAAFDRVRALNDDGLLSGVTKIVLAGIFQNFVLHEVRERFKEEEHAGRVTWSESSGLTTMTYGGIALRFNKVDDDVRPHFNDTLQSARATSQGLLFREFYAAPGEGADVPLLTIGIQWQQDLMARPVSYIVCMFGGGRLWSDPLSTGEEGGGSVVPLGPTNPKPGERGFGMRSTKVKTPKGEENAS